MNRKREAIFMGIGVLAGLALSGPAAQAATSITATLSSQPIYVDGQQVSMTAYSIGGNNYVRLRDIGRAVDFGVTYDAATNSVYIDSAQPYQEENAPTASALSEETVRATILELKKVYPHGAVYPAPTAPKAFTVPTPTVTIAQAGLCCAPMQPSETSPGGGWTTPAGRTSGWAM